MDGFKAESDVSSKKIDISFIDSENEGDKLKESNANFNDQ